MFRDIRLERSSCIFESLSEAESPHCNSHKSEDHEWGKCRDNIHGGSAGLLQRPIMTLRHLSRSHSGGNGGRPRQTSNLDLMDKEELEGVQGSTLNVNRSRTNKAARKPVFKTLCQFLQLY